MAATFSSMKQEKQEAYKKSMMIVLERQLREMKDELSQLEKAGIFNYRRTELEAFIVYRELLIDAVGKQIAKEPYFEGDGYDGDGDIIYDTATCPTCGHAFFDGDEGWHCKCCIQCGQALDWSDNDE